ncbi:MAG TPA: class I SAM-dependent RNA methyltransferase [Caulobacteraceae bacterium]|jgi:23S rRNA (uracil1939-C5)-methyltransferase
MRRARPKAFKPTAPPVELTVTAVGAQGDGVAPRPGGGSPVHVPFGLPGERVSARVEGGRGEIVELLQASADRVAPVSPHYGECGGCALQHWGHAPYLAWKAEQIRLALARERLETEIGPAFAAGPGTRRRLALHARPGRGGIARLGFKARRSWDLVEVEVCPIADPRLVAAFPALRRLAAAFLEHPKSAPTLHVTLTETGIDVDVTGVERKSGGLSADARLRAAQVAQDAEFARVTMSGEMVYGARQPMVRFGPAAVALPPGGFLQAVAAAEAAMADAAVEAARGARRIADLFCGAGAFTFRLAEVAPVLAADAAEEAVSALRAAVGTAPGLKTIAAEPRDLFRRPLSAAELKGVDAVVFDPPRAGAAAQVPEIAASRAGVVVGVSCNPATFARDARVLVDGGFRLETVTPVDQFLWSPHIELVGVFRR